LQYHPGTCLHRQQLIQDPKASFMSLAQRSCIKRSSPHRLKLPSRGNPCGIF
jgi:hypothetical protein